MTYPQGPGPQDPYGQPAPPAYPQQQYSQYPQQQPGYGGYQQPPSSGLAVGSLVCGILSLVLFWLTLIDLALVLAAVIMGHIALSKVKRGTGAGKGMAIGGLVTGYLALLLVIGVFALSIMVLNGTIHVPGMVIPTTTR